MADSKGEGDVDRTPLLSASQDSSSRPSGIDIGGRRSGSPKGARSPSPGTSSPGLGSPGGIRRPASPGAALLRAGSPASRATSKKSTGLRYTTEHRLNRYLHVAMEYTVSFCGYQAVYGGLGKIIDIIFTNSKEPLGLICPKYNDFPLDKAKENKEFAYSSTTFTIEPAHVAHDITIHSFSNGFRTYLLIECELFSQYSTRDIYQWCRSAMEIVVLSVFNQAVAHILATQYFRTIHFHDFHGVLSMLYDLRDSTVQARRALITIHNGDCQGSFPCTEEEQMDFLVASFSLDTDIFRTYCLNSGTMNMLCAFVRYCQRYQHSMGVSTISERHKKRIKQKHSLFWPLGEDQINCIPNGVDESEIQADMKEIGNDSKKLLAMKAYNKALVQRRYHLPENKDARLVSFMGRLAHQKGCDYIAGIIRPLAAIENVQVVVVGPYNDSWGERCSQMFSEKTQDLSNVHFQSSPVRGQEREELMRATDFVLMPSRFEPFGLVDVEFAWRGGLTIGSNVGGLGKVPGFYFPMDCVFRDKVEGLFLDAVRRAFSVNISIIQQMQLAALLTRFPVEVMLNDYSKYASSIQLGFDYHDTFQQVLEENIKTEQHARRVTTGVFRTEAQGTKGHKPLTFMGEGEGGDQPIPMHSSVRDAEGGSGRHSFDDDDDDLSGDPNRDAKGNLLSSQSYIVWAKVPKRLKEKKDHKISALFGTRQRAHSDSALSSDDPPHDLDLPQQGGLEIDGVSFAQIYCRRANVLWPGPLNPWNPTTRANALETSPRHMLFYWLTWLLYITSAIPSSLVFLDAAHDLDNSKNGSFIAMLYGAYGLGYAIGTLTWARLTFDYPPRTMLCAAALAQAFVLLTLTARSYNRTVLVIVILAFTSAFAGPVCLGLNYLAESPEKDVSVGRRSGWGDFLRFAIAGVVALALLLAGYETHARTVLHATIISCLLILTLVMVVVFWWGSPREYKSIVLPKWGQVQLFLLRRVPLFVFINSLFESAGNVTVALTGVMFLINEGWSEDDWLYLWFVSLISMAASSLIGGEFVHLSERSTSTKANPLNLLYLPPSYALKAAFLGALYNRSVGVAVTILCLCDFFAYMRNISINYAMITALHRELFIIGIALRAVVEGSANFITGMVLTALLEWANDFVTDSTGIVVAVAMIGILSGFFQWIIGMLLFGYYSKERLNIP